MKRAAILVIAAWFGISSVGAHGSTQTLSETEMRAAYLMNFAKFTSWPNDAVAPSAPLTLCSLDNKIASALSGIVEGQRVDSHPIAVVRRTTGDALLGCAVLYVPSKAEPSLLARIVTETRGAGVLTVGEGESFVRSGGVIGLYVEDARIRFAVNLDAMERARLRLDVKLLTLAKIVRDD